MDLFTSCQVVAKVVVKQDPLYTLVSQCVHYVLRGGKIIDILDKNKHVCFHHFQNTLFCE